MTSKNESQSATLRAGIKAICALTLATIGSASFAGPAEDADAVFGWAENNYAPYFAPAGTPSQSMSGYRLRYYSATNSYIGVNEDGSPTLYYLGPLSNNQLVDLGALSGWLAQARPPAVTGTLSLVQTADTSFGSFCSPGSISSFCTDTKLTFPYAENASASASVSCIGSGCATTYEVATFKLTAAGQSFTISNPLAANNTSGSTVAPTFVGLTNGQVIQSGQSATFKLVSPFTRGRTVSLNYRFTVAETGQTFSYNVQLRTN